MFKIKIITCPIPIIGGTILLQNSLQTARIVPSPPIEIMKSIDPSCSYLSNYFILNETSCNLY